MQYRDKFIQSISNHRFEEAHRLLDTNKNELLAIDEKTGLTVLHAISQSSELNDALKSQNKHAVDIVNLLMSTEALLLQKENSAGQTAFLMSVMGDYRVISTYQFNYVSEHYPGLLFELCKLSDNNKKTALHYAIICGNHVMIDNVLKIDTEHKLYFSCDNSGLYSLALALYQYRINPTELSLSIVNQLYFSLPKGKLRTKALEKDVYMDWGFFSTPLWRYALRFCGKRDENNNVKDIDLNLLDLVNQACDDGLTVWGYNVTKELIIEYSNSYSGTPGKMLGEAFKTLKDGLPGRTLGQARENNTISRNKEFMQRAKLSEGKYWLIKMDCDPHVILNLSKLDKSMNTIILFNRKLHYIPKPGVGVSLKCYEIKRDELSDHDKRYFDNLIQNIEKLPVDGKIASEVDLKYIAALVPLVNRSSTTHTIPTRSDQSSIIGMYMKLFGGTSMDKKIDEIELPSIKQSSTGPN